MKDTLKLGAHVSIAGGCHNALTRGNDIGCTAVQLFTKNANQWADRVGAETKSEPIVVSPGEAINL